MRTLLSDLRFALRTLRRRRAFTAVAAITIALGIGFATSIYSVVDGVLLRPLPFREPGKLVAIWQKFPDWRKEPILAVMWDHIALSVPEYRDLRDHARSFEDVAIWSSWTETLVEGEHPERVPVLRASASLLSVLGVHPALGRMFLPGEDVPNAPSVAMVSFEQWQQRFGGDPNILGKVLHFEDRPVTVVGVLPPKLTLGRTSDREVSPPAFWLPVGQTSGEDYNERTNHGYRAVARLKPGVSLERATYETVQMLRTPKKDAWLVEWQTDQTRDARAPLFILLAAVGLLLLIACANVATLLLGESATREHEMAARLALGADRARLVRQLLTESVTLAAVGGALGVVLAWVGTKALVALAPPRIPGLAQVTMDARVLAVALLAVVATGLLFGLAPALTLSRAGPGVLLRSGAGQSARGRGSLQRAMIAAELALSVVLLVGAGLLARSFEKITRVDPGFRTDHLLVVQTALPRSVLRDSIAARDIFARTSTRLGSMPGVRALTAATQPPFSGGSSSSTLAIEGETPPEAPGGRAAPPGTTRHEAQQRTVVPGYFHMLGIPVLAGREFTDDDRGGAANVVVVSEALARRDFRGESPLGKRVKYQREWWTIVGIVGDVRYESLSKDVQPTIYAPAAQRNAWSLPFLVRTAGPPAAFTATARATLADVDPRIVVTSAATMDELIRRSFAEERYRALLISLFGVLAAVLAAVGMYGVTSRAVARRTREVGIRLALGATEWSIVRQIVGYTLGGLAIGVAVGLVGSFAAGRVLSRFLFGVSATDPVTYAGILALLGAVSLVASLVPARRAARVQPASVLRSE